MATKEGGTGKTGATVADFRKRLQQLQIENKMLKGRVKKAMKVGLVYRSKTLEKPRRQKTAGVKRRSNLALFKRLATWTGRRYIHGKLSL